MLTDYTILNKIDEDSSYGTAFIAKRNSDDVELVLKFNTTPSAENDARFKRENDILQSLKPHPGIIEPLSRIESGVIDEREFQYYAMAKADQNILNWIYSNGGTELVQKLDIFKQTCIGLKHAHDNGFVHRDLHIKNVLMMTRDEIEMKLIDFGRAYDFNSMIDLSLKPAWGEFVIPPEIRIKGQESPIRSQYIKGDIFALGILWKFLFHGPAVGYEGIKSIISSIEQFVSQESGSMGFVNYYQLTDSTSREAIYEKWIQTQSASFSSYYDIPDINPNLGAKLSDICSKLVNFDIDNRISSIDDVLLEIESI